MPAAQVAPLVFMRPRVWITSSISTFCAASMVTALVMHPSMLAPSATVAGDARQRAGTSRARMHRASPRAHHAALDDGRQQQGRCCRRTSTSPLLADKAPG